MLAPGSTSSTNVSLSTAIRKIIGPKRGKVIGKWRKLHKDKLHYSYSSINIIKATKAWRIRLAGHVAYMGGKRNAYRIFIGKPERYHFEDLGIDARIILTRKLM